MSIRQISIIGGAAIDPAVIESLRPLVAWLIQRFTEHGVTIFNGSGGGLAGLWAAEARKQDVYITGISPFSNAAEHRAQLDEDPALYRPIIFTGQGFKGRNVTLIRSADAVLAMGGGVGTLNELTIAWDEGKRIALWTGHQASGQTAHLFSELAPNLPKRNADTTWKAFEEKAELADWLLRS